MKKYWQPLCNPGIQNNQFWNAWDVSGCQQLERLHEAIIVKRQSLVNRKGVILHQVDARPHTAKVTQNKIRGFLWDLLPITPYTTDITLSEYYLFLFLLHFLPEKDLVTWIPPKALFPYTLSQRGILWEVLKNWCKYGLMSSTWWQIYWWLNAFNLLIKQNFEMF